MPLSRSNPCLPELTISPRGTVVAADVFSSGIILSESAPILGHAPILMRSSTDFGQFEKYLGVSGLDVRQLIGILRRS